MPTAFDLDPAGLLPSFQNSLASVLRRSGERRLLKTHQLTRKTYSTQRFLSGSPDTIAAPKSIPVLGKNSLICEGRSSELIRYATKHGLRLASERASDKASDLITAALMEVVMPYPFLSSAVSELAWHCHVVLAIDNDYDVSFSDPAIPFSVFISVPARGDRRSLLRTAESLIHETMHLQLTLFEALSPLVDETSTSSMFSPWKQQERPVQGILHGLYVFGVLRWMWRQVSDSTQNMPDREFALRRISQINEDVSAVRALEESPALTENGRRFLHQLFVLGKHS
jgi:hypothetical protein